MKYERIGKFQRKGPPATEKFDMTRPPVNQNKALMIPVRGFARLRKHLHLGKVNKINMEGIRAPYILLLNHNAFYDFYIMLNSIAPDRGIFPAAVDDYLGREEVLRKLGAIPKRKYTADLSILRNCRKTLKDGKIFGIYVEARYSLCGLTEVIPKSVAQLVRGSGVPVVTLTCHGHHIYDPFWGNHRVRWVKPISADMTLAYAPEELKQHSVEEIYDRICELLYNDDFRWQSENRVKVTYKKRAEGLHKVLYKCPHCNTEYETDSKYDEVFCKKCGKRWKLNYYGELEANDGNTEFKFPTDWYKWEREEVKKEVDAGTYRFESPVEVNDLPNSKSFIYMGKGNLVHDMTGFHLKGIREYDGEPFSMEINAAEQYAVHIEYNYRYGQKRDCIDLNTIDDTWYVFPTKDKFAITKISLATEEIFKKIWADRQKAKELEAEKSEKE